MKERPILFSAPMVRAILEGRKTQTRRIIKAKNMVIRGDDGIWYDADCIRPGIPLKCPYGQPGDRLWLKETWKPDPAWGHPQKTKPTDIEEGTNILYRATLPEDHPKASWMNWRPAIFMRRWMSRITLEVTGVRVERLQEISEADAISEGINTNRSMGVFYHQGTLATPYAREQFGIPADAPFGPCAWYAGLWESINGPGSWDANPWVWVLNFKVL